MDVENNNRSLQANLLSVAGINGIVVALIGLALLILGIQLIGLGGSWYYAIAGLSLVISGILISARRHLGLCLYGLVLLGTVIWAIYEVGFDGWKLFPRIFAPAVLGIWLCLPWVSRSLVIRKGNTIGLPKTAWVGAVMCAVIAAGVVIAGYRTSAMEYRQYAQVGDAGPMAAANPPVADDEWKFYGRTADGDRFSPLKEITPGNVSKLEIAWQYRTGDLAQGEDSKKGREYNFEVTPTKVGDNLFLCTPHAHVISLNATTGKQNWAFDPGSDTSANIFHACRGVAYYESPSSTVCPRRIISTAGDPRMVALNADTGKPCEDFGEHGFINLTDHMGEVPPGFHFITSEPLVMNDRLVLGGWIYDNEAEGEPSGVVRAYDPTSGKLIWAWDLGRADPNAPLAQGEQYTRGTPNAWGVYTADAKLGLVYLPLGNATPDYFGGHRRPFDDKYNSSVVALDIATGKERWHFQTVHHDLWDFDLPIGPSLVDLKTADGIVPALVQTTKRGEFFVLDRRDGHPLTGITEKPVPQNPAPGEHLSPTQPYPDFPSLAPQNVTEKDTWGATPIDQLMCRIDFLERRYAGQFTPPTLGKYLAYPAFLGVMDWFGASIDPTRNLLIANATYMPMSMEYLTQEDAMKQGKVAPWKGWGNPFPKLISVGNNPQYKTPYAIIIGPWLNKIGVPCMAPPWGKLTAIDLNTRKIAWQRPLGTARESGPFGTHLHVPLPTGIPNMGGNVITGSGLIFIGATADNNMRAFDEKTGKMLWETTLPFGGNATPMTYTGNDGRQYVVIAAGGHGGLATALGDAVIAYAPPKAQ